MLPELGEECTDAFLEGQSWKGLQKELQSVQILAQQRGSFEAQTRRGKTALKQMRKVRVFWLAQGASELPDVEAANHCH